MPVIINLDQMFKEIYERAYILLHLCLRSGDMADMALFIGVYLSICLIYAHCLFVIKHYVLI